MYIYKAGVIGAGTMGAEIAQVITYSGLPVVLRDISSELVASGVEKIRAIYASRVKKGKMTDSDMESKMALVTGTTSLEALADADIVIEAVPENLELKKKVFAELDKACRESTILATNTSALSISAIGSATKRPGKVVGMHFFFPAHVMKLVEVIPGLATDEETVADVTAFAESLRKLPVRVEECAGFLVNRLLMPYLNEAAYCLQEGAADVKALDAAVSAFGLPMGPFILVDALGIDVCADVVGVLLGSYGFRMRPAEIWKKLHAAKRFGAKSGGGFYVYNEGEKDPLPEMIAQVQKETGVKGTAFSVERVLYPMVNEAAYCLEERVASAKDIDLAMLAGVGWPQAKTGLLAWADEVGLDSVLATLEKLQLSFGERFFPAPRLRRMVDAGFLGKKTKRGFHEYT